MIDFYYWPTPNGWKVSILLEELGIAYNMIPVNIRSGDQFKPDFLAISPNNRMPAIVDHNVDGEPISVFESGAIMTYLAQKHRQFIPTDIRERIRLDEWLYWQVGNLGPMAGQHSHFFNYAQGDDTYSAERYKNEYNRCIGVLERRLEGREYVLDSGYSIADMCSWPWILIAKAMGQPLDEFPNVTRWRSTIKDRAAVRRGVDLGKELNANKPMTDEERNVSFGQTAETVRKQQFAKP
ncbi:MAG: glutathione S-transferase family protein [Granulosicoccus sp.]